MSNVDMEGTDSVEKNRVVEELTQELKNSGWARKDAREMVVNGLLGWTRKHQRRADMNQDFYRSAASTLTMRTRKKLTEKSDWYKGKSNGDALDDIPEENAEVRPHQFASRKRNDEQQRHKDEQQRPAKKNDIKGVINCPCTPGGELAKRIRAGEEELRGPTGYVVKVVEKVGSKIIDMVHKTNPWRGEDCERDGCFHCKTKAKTGKLTTQCCKKRNMVYETWCISCEEKAIKEIEEQDDTDKEKKAKINNIMKFKYLGESCRSTFERGFEHAHDLEQLNPKSHMLRHCIDQHQGVQLEEVEFGMKVVQYTRTSFERQILESVKIQENRNHHILNSKSEYNRCALPRLATKIGENDFKRWEETQKDDKDKEMEMERKIRTMRMQQNKQRQPAPTSQQLPAQKKRKIDNNRYFKVFQSQEEGEKRKSNGEKTPEAKRTRLDDKPATGVNILH